MQPNLLLRKRERCRPALAARNGCRLFGLVRPACLQIFPDQLLLATLRSRLFLRLRAGPMLIWATALGSDRRDRGRRGLLRLLLRSCSRLGTELDPQRFEPAQSQVRAPLDRFRHEREIGEPPQERLEHNLAFHTRQRSAKAEVSGVTECQMPIVFTSNIETVRIR